MGGSKLRHEASIVREAELALLNAPFDPGGWDGAIAAVAAATGSSGAQLIGVGGPLVIPLNVVVGNFVGPWQHFSDARLYGSCNWRINTVGVQGSIQHEQHFAAYAAGHDTADYDDAVADLDVPFGCQSAFLIDPDRLVGLSLLRRQRDGACDADTLRRFAHLRIQAGRAVRMQLALDGEAAALMLGTMSAMASATILLDRHGNIAAMTDAAELLFEPGGPLRRDMLAPRLRHREEDRLLSAAMARLLAHDGHGAHVHRARVGRGADCPAGGWELYLVRLPAREHGLGFDAHLALTFKPAIARPRSTNELSAAAE